MPREHCAKTDQISGAARFASRQRHARDETVEAARLASHAEQSAWWVGKGVAASAAEMAVEFALRPRIRLREERTPRRRSRFRLPKFALPVAGYWLAMACVTYAFVHSHEPFEARTSAKFDVLAAPLSVRPAASNPAPRAAAQTESARTAKARAATDVPPAAFFATRTTPARAAPAGTPLLSNEPARTELPAPAAAFVPHGLPSCEAALAASSQDLDFSPGNRAADLPAATISAQLDNAAWFASCPLLESTSLDVCVAISGGRVVGVTVATRPVDPALNRCVSDRAAALQFPYSARLDVARTRF